MIRVGEPTLHEPENMGKGREPALNQPEMQGEHPERKVVTSQSLGCEHKPKIQKRKDVTLPTSLSFLSVTSLTSLLTTTIISAKHAVSEATTCPHILVLFAMAFMDSWALSGPKSPGYFITSSDDK